MFEIITSDAVARKIFRTNRLEVFIAIGELGKEAYATKIAEYTNNEITLVRNFLYKLEEGKFADPLIKSEKINNKRIFEYTDIGEELRSALVDDLNINLAA